MTLLKLSGSRSNMIMGMSFNILRERQNEKAIRGSNDVLVMRLCGKTKGGGYGC